MTQLKGVTVSERVFEEYLLARGHENFRYEEKIEGINKVVDYSLDVAGATLRCEVKEWELEDVHAGAGMIGEPYEPVRDKIEEGRIKFKEYKSRNEPCVLVLHHYGPQLILLDPISIYSAMLGDIGFVFPVHTDAVVPIGDEGHSEFLGGGKMVHKKSKVDEEGQKIELVRLQNKTISGIALTYAFHVRGRMMSIEYHKRLGENAKKIDRKQSWDIIVEIDKDLEDFPPEPCVEMHDNPVAPLPVPKEFPAGPYDQRYAFTPNGLERVYVGPKLLELEATERDLDILKDPYGLKS